jgi:outer membrane cobalamin receptor
MSVVADSLGIVRLDLEQTNEVYTFSRLGYTSVKKTTAELRRNPIVRMEIVPLSIEGMVVRGERESAPFRMSSKTIKIEIDDSVSNLTTIDDLLRDISFIDMHGIALSGERQTITLGGHSSRHTIVMLDGVVLNPTGQAIDLSSLPTMQIESIEIVKNNASVEAGSGGIAGMVILHTKKGNQKNEFYISESVGSFNTVKQNIGFNFSERKFNIMFNLTQVYAENNFEYEYRNQTQIRTDNTKKSNNLGVNLRWSERNFTSDYSFRYLDFHNMLPGPINNANLYKGAFQMGTNTHHQMSINSSRIDFSIYTIKNHSIYENTIAPMRRYYAKDENIQNIRGGKVGYKQRLNFEDLSFRFNIGSEVRGEDFQQNDLLWDRFNLEKVKQQTGSGFGSVSIRYDMYFYEPEIVFASRYDVVKYDIPVSLGSNTKNSEHTTYRIELNQNFYTHIPIQIKANIGTAYMIPSFYEMFPRGDSHTMGNPDLLPESSLGWRIDAIVNSNPSIRLAYWQNQTDNLIYWYRSVLGWKPGNIGRSEIKNYEVYSEYGFPSVFGLQTNVSANYNRTIARDVTPNSDFYGKYIIHKPSHRWNIETSLSYQNFTQSMNYQKTGKQWTTRDQLIPALPSYETYNTRTSYFFQAGNLRTVLNFNLFNIFDSRYHNYTNIPEPGRHWEASVGVRIGS